MALKEMLPAPGGRTWIREEISSYLAHLGYYLSSPDSKKQGIKHRDYNSHPGRDLPTMVFDIYARNVIERNLNVIEHN